MIVRYFSIERAYEIKCKLFVPGDEAVENVIIGVHGFAGDKESSALEALAKACEQSRCALLCFDFPAHGNSPASEENLTIENCKNDLLAVVAYAQRTWPKAKKSIFATSFGGYITLLSAANMEEIPFVLRAPAVTMPKILMETILHTSAEEFRKAGSMQCGFERRIDLPYSFCEELTAQAELSELPIRQAMLVIHGERDDVVPIVDVEAFVTGHNSAQLRRICGADHRFKNPGEMEAVIAFTREFLRV